MGASSSTFSKYNIDYDSTTDHQCKRDSDCIIFSTGRDEYKNEDEYTAGDYYEDFPKEDDVEQQSPVWVAINAILNSILIIRKDFQKEKPEILLEVMKKIVMNMDSIYNIRETTFEYDKIQSITIKDLEIVKNMLKNYYENESVIIIKLKDNIPFTHSETKSTNSHEIANLSIFMYDIFNFQIKKNCLYVYV